MGEAFKLSGSQRAAWTAGWLLFVGALAHLIRVL